MRNPPNFSLVIRALEQVEKPECRMCPHLAERTSMIMFTACNLNNRLTMPVEAAKMLTGGYCPDDCPILNERVMTVLKSDGTLNEALMDQVGGRPRGSDPALAIAKTILTGGG